MDLDEYIQMEVIISIALSTLYPEHWQIWDQHKLHYNRKEKQKGYYNSMLNQRAFFEHLASKLKIKNQEDWYHVLGKTVVKEGGSFINGHYNGSVLRGKSDYNWILCYYSIV
jgi:hypothetical protein